VVSDFGALPPEVNSGRIYAGPGSTSLTTAASAWNALAAELNSAALGYQNVVTQLTGEEWLGPASTALAEAVSPYTEWVTTTAAQAEQAASQATAAAAAFETAFASVVPPPVIAANRAELAQAVATNVLGQNSGIIAQLEAQYGDFWAQDASALYSYAGQAAAATKVTPFTAAPQVANPAASATQGAAVTSATATSAASNTQSTLSQLISSLPSKLQSLVSPNSTATTLTNPIQEIYFLLTGNSTLPTSLGSLVNAYSPYAGFFYNTEGLPYFSVGMANSFVQVAKATGTLGGAAPAAAKAATGAAGAAGGAAGAAGKAGGGIAAGLGSGAHVASLSVPHTWPGALAHTGLEPRSVPVSGEFVNAVPDHTTGNLVGGVPAGAVGGSGRGGVFGPKYGFKPTVMARPMPAG